MTRIALVSGLLVLASCAPTREEEREIHAEPRSDLEAAALASAEAPQASGEAPRASAERAGGVERAAPTLADSAKIQPEGGPQLAVRVPARPGACIPGQRRLCFPHADPTCEEGLVPNAPVPLICVAMAGSPSRWIRAGGGTPLVLAFDAAPIRFTTPDRTNAFSIGGAPFTQWVASDTPWLALDRDGSGCIERQSELFGPDATSTNGFETLKRLDDDGNGRIDASDPAFAKLVLWRDRDQDRRCTKDELSSLGSEGIVSLDLAYTTPEPPDAGSYEGERASLAFVDRTGKLRAGRVVDVHVAPMGEVPPLP